MAQRIVYTGGNGGCSAVEVSGVQWRVVAAILFALIVAVFAVVNVHAEPVDFVFVRVHVPLVLIILGAALCGGLAVFTVGLASSLRLLKETRTLRAELQEARAHVQASADQETAAETGLVGADMDAADGLDADGALHDTSDVAISVADDAAPHTPGA
jgi:putative membrane protein